MTTRSDEHSRSRIAPPVLWVTMVKLLVHVAVSQRYGYFVDELYYLACARHLDWGYVDQPPLIAVVARFVEATLGNSLVLIRLVPAFAGGLEVLLAGMIARELGAGAYGQGLAALATLVAPGILTIDGFFSMNALEPLFWLGCAWLLIRILKTDNSKLWLWFGILAGIGVENKYSMLMFGAGLVVGLLLTPERRLLTSPWPWFAFGAVILIFLPNLIWNVHYHFPFLELQANIRHSGRDVALQPAGFFAQEALAMHPLTLPLWLAGLWFFFSAEGRRFRALGWAWVFTAVVIVVVSPRIYYLFPAFPLLFAAGAAVMEKALVPAGRLWLKRAWPVALAVTGCLLAPLAIPLLPPETYVAYTKTLHIDQPAIERHRLGPLPQIFADQFGWEEMTAAVADAFHRLPPEVQVKTAIFGQNYGQAGAIDLFGPRYGLPPAISGHQNYYLWGPRGYTGESVLVMDGTPETLGRQFSFVEKVGTVRHRYSMPYQQFDLYYCRGLKQPLAELWPQLKQWD